MHYTPESVPAADREAYIVENAVAIVNARDRKIENLRKAVRRLERRSAALAKERERDDLRRRLRESMLKERPLTVEEAQKAYDEAEPVPLSQERIKEIVDYATRPRNVGDLCPMCGCCPCVCPPCDEPGQGNW